MSNGQYAFDNDWAKARQRLSALERIEDPATIEHLEHITVAEGWHCLEVGAGGGSIAEWLCRRVGATGYVVATDIDTRYLDVLNFPQLKVIEHNVLTDDLEVSRFDLVHTRNLLIHFPDRIEVLRKMADAVKPGGWVLIEESDFITNQCDTTTDDAVKSLFDKTLQEIYKCIERRGFDLHLGGKLFALLHSLGFEGVHGEGRATLFQGAASNAEFHRLSYEQLRAPVLSAGQVSEQQFDDFLNLFGNPSFFWRGPLRVSVWGRRPRL